MCSWKNLIMLRSYSIFLLRKLPAAKGSLANYAYNKERNSANQIKAQISSHDDKDLKNYIFSNNKV